MRTCPHCGYEINQCRCGTGEAGTTPTIPGKFNYYQDYSKDDTPYARTSPIQRNSGVVKHFPELSPLNDESVTIWAERIDRKAHDLTQHARWYHLYGTRKAPWPCHSTTMYCFICTLCDLVDNMRHYIDSTLLLYPKNDWIWVVRNNKEGYPQDFKVIHRLSA